MIMPNITHHGPVYQQLLTEKDITKEIQCRELDTLLHLWGPDVITECITYFIGKKYAHWISNEKTAFKLTADGKSAYLIWEALPTIGNDHKPKSDFM